MSLNRQSFEKALNQFPIEENDRLLVAVSGGVDSVVLCHLLFECKKNFAIAHVNYGLRGAESDRDEQFCEALAKSLEVSFFLKRIDVEKEEPFQNKGIQEAARIARYLWFEELLSEHPFSFLLTAHHQDDQVETILFQFLRGGMFAALRGMQLQNERIMRPLLSFGRKEIKSYAMDHRLTWMEDSSNEGTGYSRNALRLDILPYLSKHYPGFGNSLIRRAPIFREAELLVSEVVGKDLKDHLKIDENEAFIRRDWLMEYPYKRLLLWLWLEKYHFTPHQMDDVMHLLSALSGSMVASSSHVLQRERDELVLMEKREKRQWNVVVNSLPFIIEEPQEASFSEHSVSEVSFDRGQTDVYLDLDLLVFPLVVRTWKHGDKFQPLGMKGHQLVSDFLIQEKIPVRHKEFVLVVESGQEIAAIIGMRPNDKFKITPSTQRVARIRVTHLL